MSEVPEGAKPAAGDAPAAHPPVGSGEGADTAFQAMIRNRKLRADDEAPTAAPEAFSDSPSAE